jgi:integrase
LNKPTITFEGKKYTLNRHPNGQWWRSINGHRYYFGRIEEDPTGVTALVDLRERLPLILAGADHIRREKADDGTKPLGILTRLFLEHVKQKVADHEMSLDHYGDYLKELPKFVAFAGVNTSIKQLSPAVFSAFHREEMVGKRKLGRHQRRKVYALLKRLFRWGADSGYCRVPAFGPDFVPPSVDKDAMRMAKMRAGQADYSDRVATGEEIDKLLERANPQFKAMILLGVNCGLGPMDLARLRWSNINFATGELNFPRGKTGAARRSYLWKKTRRALERVSTLKHNKAALEQHGEDALVFLTRKQLPFVRLDVRVEDGAEVRVTRSNSISLTFGRMVAELEEKGMPKGLTFYRLRHTFETLGAAARDKAALDLAMGHKAPGMGAHYDHSILPLKRLKRLSKRVYSSLWPRPEGERKPQTQGMRLADAA